MAVLDTFKVQNLTQYQRRDMVTVVAHLARGALPAKASPVELSVRPAGSTNPNDNIRVQWLPLGPRYPDNSYRTIVCHFIVTVAAGTTDPVYAHFGETEWDLVDEECPAGNLPGHTIHPSVAAGLFPTGGATGADIGFAIQGETMQFGGAARDWADKAQFEIDFRAPVRQLADNEDAVNLKYKLTRRARPPGGTAPNLQPSFLAGLEIEVPDGLPVVYFNTWIANSEIREDNDVQRESAWFELTNHIRFFTQGVNTGAVFFEEEYWFPTAGSVPEYRRNRKTTQDVGNEERSEYLFVDIRGTDGQTTGANNAHRRLFPFSQQHWRSGVLFFAPQNALESDTILANTVARLEAVSKNAAARNEFGAGKFAYTLQGNTTATGAGGLATAARRTAKGDFDAYIGDPGDHYRAPLHGNPGYAGASGAHTDFGTVKSLHHVNGYSSDFRALRISMMHQHHRPFWNWNTDGTLPDYIADSRFKDPSRPWLTSRYLPYPIHTFHGNRGGITNVEPPWAHGLGVRMNAGGSSLNPGDYAGNRIYALTRSHLASNYLTGYVLLTGDTFARRYLVPSLKNATLAILHRSIAERDRLFQATNNDLFVGFGQTREHARVLQAAMNFYCVTGDQRCADAAAMQLDEHHRRQWFPARSEYSGKPVEIWQTDEISQFVGPLVDTNGAAFNAGIAGFQHVLIAFAAHAARLWISEDNNPDPDPYWDQGGLVADPPPEELFGR